MTNQKAANENSKLQCTCTMNKGVDKVIFWGVLYTINWKYKQGMSRWIVIKSFLGKNKCEIFIWGSKIFLALYYSDYTGSWHYISYLCLCKILYTDSLLFLR